MGSRGPLKVFLVRYLDGVETIKDFTLTTLLEEVVIKGPFKISKFIETAPILIQLDKPKDD